MRTKGYNGGKRSSRPVDDGGGEKSGFQRGWRAKFGQKSGKIEKPTPAQNSESGLEAKIEKAKERLRGKEEMSKKSVEEGKGGINVEIHPLLRSINKTTTAPRVQNPLKRKTRQLFDPAAINPYLNQEDRAIAADFGKIAKRPRKLEFNEHGKYISKAEEIRQKLMERHQEELKFEETRAKGLVPDESLGEHLYTFSYPPMVEWWDQPFLKDRTYEHRGDETRVRLNNPDAPISLYIQHPVLTVAPWEKNLPETQAVYLTKKERKRIRRNERQEKHREQQDRIKLGLDPPPPPKIKLSNLMNVLTNEAIKDPTSVEMRVREEVEQRYRKHMEENEARKLTPKEKHNKIHQLHEKDISKGIFSTFYKISLLANPQHLFKVDINAKQLELVGICLVNPKVSLVIVEGGAKSIRFYKKLLTSRIDWSQNAPPKDTVDTAPLQDLLNNKCEVLWEGEKKDLGFKRWSIMNTQNDDEALDVLYRFGLQNYWYQAISTNPTD